MSPDKNGRFAIGVTNYTDEDLELGQEMVLGHLSEVRHIGRMDMYALNAVDQPPSHAIWRVASHIWSDPEKEEMKPAV